VINIGELETPINGVLWVKSRRWPLASKFTTDFDDVVLARLMDTKAAGTIQLKPNLRRTQAVLSSGNSTATALQSSGRRTGVSLFLAGERTGGAIDGSKRNTEAALVTAQRNTGKALNATGKAVRKSMRKTSDRASRLFGAKWQ
jgi:hypothetical protein